MRFTAHSVEGQVNRVRAIEKLLVALEDLQRVGLMVREPILLERLPGEDLGAVAGGVVRVGFMNESIPNSAFYYIFGDDQE